MYDPQQITIFSGGQTGADRAALDFAIAYGLSHEGWCPRGRLAEDGEIPAHYNLRETPAKGYEQRTRWNVRDADATLLLTISPVLLGGTRLTRDVAEQFGRPWKHVSQTLGSGQAVSGCSPNDDPFGRSAEVELRAIGIAIWRFLAEHEVQRLNVAGPRASQEPGIGLFVWAALEAAFSVKGS